MKTGGKENNRETANRNERGHDFDAQSKFHGLLTEKDKMLE